MKQYTCNNCIYCINDTEKDTFYCNINKAYLDDGDQPVEICKNVALLGEDLLSYYKIYHLSSGDYIFFIICLSYESLTTYINELQCKINDTEIKNGQVSGQVLIDQLMISNNGKNRFLSLNFKEGQFDFSSAQNVNADYCYRYLTSFELKKNVAMLKNSILSSEQIAMIEDGFVI